MGRVYDYIFPAIWIAWLIYWKIAARGVKTPSRLDSPGFQIAYTLPLLAAIQFFWTDNLTPFLARDVMPASPWLPIVGLMLQLAGLFLAIWARRILGRNWSSVVTVKIDHTLVRDGPYCWVRHLIYAGLLLAFFGSALAQDRVGDLPIVPLVALGFWIKMRREEAWMRETFGAVYDDYCRQTARLVPGLF